jgi:hypothetical protein
MDACEAHLAELGRTPVLEVVADAHSRALGLYLARGWQAVGEVRPHWLPEGEGPVKIMVLGPRGDGQADTSRGTDSFGTPPRPSR